MIPTGSVTPAAARSKTQPSNGRTQSAASQPACSPTSRTVSEWRVLCSRAPDESHTVSGCLAHRLDHLRDHRHFYLNSKQCSSDPTKSLITQRRLLFSDFDVILCMCLICS